MFINLQYHTSKVSETLLVDQQEINQRLKDDYPGLGISSLAGGLQTTDIIMTWYVNLKSRPLSEVADTFKVGLALPTPAEVFPLRKTSLFWVWILLGCIFIGVIAAYITNHAGKKKSSEEHYQYQ